MDKLKTEKILRYAKKIKAINYLGRKCIKCNEENMFKLTFHHIDTNDKEFEISDFAKARWSLLEKELNKCILLCNNCHREIHFLEDKNNERRTDKIIYLEYKGSKCIKCGYNKCPAALSFHHRISNEKEFWIGGLNERLNSINELEERIKKEIDKCDILCMNCHTLEHSDIEFFDKYKDEIYYKVFNYKEIQAKIDRTEVIKMYNSGLKQIEIAKYFNASKGTISDIIKYNGK